MKDVKIMQAVLMVGILFGFGIKAEAQSTGCGNNAVNTMLSNSFLSANQTTIVFSEVQEVAIGNDGVASVQGAATLGNPVPAGNLPTSTSWSKIIFSYPLSDSGTTIAMSRVCLDLARQAYAMRKKFVMKMNILKLDYVRTENNSCLVDGRIVSSASAPGVTAVPAFCSISK